MVWLVLHPLQDNRGLQYEFLRIALLINKPLLSPFTKLAQFPAGKNPDQPIFQ
jgi:hypothetical protein